MHSAQRRAVLAILSMIESGLREIRAVLSDGEPVEASSHVGAVGYVAPEPYKSYVPDGTLSDDEESTLEAMMEKHRLDLIAAAGNLANVRYAERDHYPERELNRITSPFFEEDEP